MSNELSHVRLASFDPNRNFKRGASKLKLFAWYFCKMSIFLTPIPFPNFVKRKILIMFGATIGKGLVLKPRVNIHFPWKLTIGTDVWIGEEVFILNFETATIGNNVCISQRAFLCGGNHDYRDPSMSYRNGTIDLLDGCWVGAQTFIGPGVRIGVDSIVSAGSVVTKSVEGNGIYRGNPAEFVGNRWKE